MSRIEKKLTSAILSAAQGLYGGGVSESMLTLQKTKREFEGHLTLVCFPLLKLSKKSPADTAEEIGKRLLDDGVIEKYNVVKGFLNLSMKPSVFGDVLSEIDAAPDFGRTAAGEESELVMVEFSSPNTNKPQHLGHCRNNLLGMALSRLLEACGKRVVKTNIINDRGIHICKSMLAWQKWGNGETPASSGKKGDHLVGDYYVLFDKHYKQEVCQIAEKYQQAGLSEEEAKKRGEQESPLMLEAREMLRKWEEGDAEVRQLWQTMNSWVYEGFGQTYEEMGVSFDKIYYESQTYMDGKAKVQEGLEKGIFYKREDGSVWCDLRDAGLDEKLLLRSDGTSVYMTQDIGTAAQRFSDYPIDRMIYVVGNEQNYHFQVLSIVLDRLGFKWGKDLVHYSYGMVELPNGKMKSREGTVVDADDLMAEMRRQARQSIDESNHFEGRSEEEKDDVARRVGLGALKYFLLKVDAKKNMLFNPEESIDFNGNTGPFVQYTYARIRSIERKAAEAGLNAEVSVSADVPLEPKEQELIQHLAEYEDTIAAAGASLSPSLVANYCFELAKEFNQFYHEFQVLKEPDAAKRDLRRLLARNVAKVLKSGMEILGIEMPERM